MNRKQDRSRWTGILGHDAEITGHVGPKYAVAKESLAEQVAGQSVAVEWDKVDRYGRKVGKVLLNGLDSNLVQIKRGLAWHYKQYEREQSPADRQSYAAAEAEARAAKLGLWRDAAPERGASGFCRCPVALPATGC